MDSRDFLREARIMKELRHPNLIQLYAVGIISKKRIFRQWALFLHRNSYESVALLYALSQIQIFHPLKSPHYKS